MRGQLLEPVFDNAKNEEEGAMLAPIVPPDVAIQLNDMSFRYPGGRLAISGITMPIYDGVLTAIIGPSAAASLRCFDASTGCTTYIRECNTEARPSFTPKVSI